MICKGIAGSRRINERKRSPQGLATAGSHYYPGFREVREKVGTRTREERVR